MYVPISLVPDSDFDAPRRAASGHGNEAVIERGFEIQVDVQGCVEKAPRIPIVQRLDADHLRARLEPRNDERAVCREGEPPNELARRGIERRDVSAKNPGAVLGDASGNAA